jgi:hypothetical protein
VWRPGETFASSSWPDSFVVPRRKSSSQTTAFGSVTTVIERAAVGGAGRAAFFCSALAGVAARMRIAPIKTRGRRSALRLCAWA